MDIIFLTFKYRLGIPAWKGYIGVCISLSCTLFSATVFFFLHFDFYRDTQQGWVIHVSQWVVGIRGLLHIPDTCALLQFVEVPHKHWPLAVESTGLDSVNTFYFLHQVRFGGLSEEGLCGTGLGYAEQEAEVSDSSDLDESRVVKGRYKRDLSWSHGVGATS